MILFLITLGLGLVSLRGTFALSGTSTPGGSDVPGSMVARPAIRLTPERTIEVVGLPSEQLSHLRQTISTTDWRSLFPVFTGTAWPVDDRPQLLGRYEVTDSTIRFTPTFPLNAGVSYVAQFRSNAGSPALQETFAIPDPGASKILVTHIYPSDPVPENLLKFYIHFSGPMRRGNVYESIHLFDEGGSLVNMPFVEVDPPLWDPSARRLTLLFEPGRIKRGLRQHDEQGLPLGANGTFRLVIDSQMRDATGQSLMASHEKSFRVTASDRRSSRVEDWKVRAPSARTREALTVTLDEPMDHALLHSMIDVYTQNHMVDGEIAVREGEREWRFTPKETWRAGNYELRINVLLEDLAGNRIDRLFDVDIMSTEDQEMEDIGEWTTRRFNVQ